MGRDVFNYGDHPCYILASVLPAINLLHKRCIPGRIAAWLGRFLSANGITLC
jgi:hypothetical protein